VEFLVIALAVAALPFVLPIATWVSGRRTRARVRELEDVAVHLHGRIRQLEKIVDALQGGGETATPRPAPAAAEAPSPQSEAAQPPPPTVGRRDLAPSPSASAVGPALPPIPEKPEHPPVKPPAMDRPRPARPAAAAVTTAASADARADGEAEKPPAPSAAFDWESLVGVKLFSAIAGIALALAGILFLSYSIEHGWLQPPVRVAIGVVVATALLVLCELKAARRYPVTANALDAAAIAILFATFFAAHALWDLIPAAAAFVLLALVTAVAVLLSIRRDSLFIAVLGLLGGFSTPALLSTGENRPIPLFAYLLLLNIGLAWVAQQRAWPVLSWLTLILTALYQWGWVFRFLAESSLTLAMGVFIVFPIASMATLVVVRRGRDESGVQVPDRTAAISAALPLLFAAYLAAVPEYGSRASLLFGFLLLVDAGLLAIALARRDELLHTVGAMATVLTMGIWLAMSYPGPDARVSALAFLTAGVLLYLLAPVVGARAGRAFEGAAIPSVFAAPLLLFAFPVLARIEPAFASPWPLAATLLVLVSAVAIVAVRTGVGALYYLAAFFAVATQAVWSSRHLTPDRLGTAVALYAAFAAVALGVPLLARRAGRALQPAWGGGVVLLVSLGLLLFLSWSPIAPAALWALALLLAILNAAIFVESAAGALPGLSQAGTILSWVVLANWWARAAGAVGVIPSLTVLTGLTLVTLGGHAWAARQQPSDRQPSFAGGLYLALGGHLFLLLLASNPAWSIPPWPIFGSLAVITLASSAGSLAVRASTLHGAAVVAAAMVVVMWAGTSGDTLPRTALLAATAIGAYALAWIRVSRREHGASAALAAAAVVALGQVAALAVAESAPPPGFGVLLLFHTIAVAVLLALTARYSWKFAAAATSLLAWLVVFHWQFSRETLYLHAGRAAAPGAAEAGAGLWPSLLLLAGSLYALFVAYPVAVGRRRHEDREPYVAAIIASAMLFFSARAALAAGGLTSLSGAVPVVEGLVLAWLLRHLLRLEPSGQRDVGRLALVAGAALAFATVAIPVQLDRQWVTIGWALEGAALAWLYGRVPHRGLLYACAGLLGVVFVRLAIYPGVLTYEPRGALPILNWYLYTYLISAGCCFVAGWWLSKTDEHVGGTWTRPSRLLPPAGAILLFLLLNIEIADYYATGPALTFRFGATVAQDLTYTIGWLLFGMALLAAGIYLRDRATRIAAVTLIAVTTFKCFLYDLGSLEGLHRVASFLGLAVSLALVSLALQRYVLGQGGRTPAPEAGSE
jgi:uncharacterized membrane protein